MRVMAASRALIALSLAGLLANCAGGAAPPAMPAQSVSERSIPLRSTAGSLDRTFGHDGKAIFTLALNPIATVVQADGRIVIAGDVGSAPGQVAVARLLPNGKLDQTFGSGGTRNVNMWNVASLTLLGNGDILLGGIASTGKDAALVRILPGGTLDSSFGNGGAVQFDYVANSSNGVLAAVAQPDGSVVAGGFGLATNSDVYLTSLARFDASGKADPNFGTNGVVALDLVGGVTALGLQSDGKILVCGGFITPATSLVVRFLHNGMLDRTDTGGALVAVAHTGSLTFGGTNEFQLDGKLVQWKSVVGKGGGHYVKIVRLLRDNKPDRTFKSLLFAFASPAFGQANDVEIASDGSLLAGGGGDRSGYEVFGLARLRATGPLDRAFGRDGRVTTSFGSGAEVTALALQADGRIIAAGTVSSGGSQSQLAVARYLGN